MSDDEFDTDYERRELLIRRVNAVMGWEYSTGPVWGGLRAVAQAKAVAISLDKLEFILERLESNHERTPQAPPRPRTLANVGA